MTVGFELEALTLWVVANVGRHVGCPASRSLHNRHLRKLVQSATFARCSMPNLTLYHAAPSRSSVVLWMLEELGEPYDIRLLRLRAGENMKPDYLAINPMGKVPALKHGDIVITELAAICTYLADEFPEKKLNVPIGTPKRGVYLKWLFFGPGCLEPAVV